MTTNTIIVEATLQPDGVTLHLDKKLAIPPGKVTVTLQPNGPMTGPTMLEVLENIHRFQQKQGLQGMTEVEMAAEIAHIRGEDDVYEGRWRETWFQTTNKPDKTDNP